MTSFRPKSSFVLFFVIALLVAASAFAQGATGRVEGVVTDNTGALLPGVTVTATNTGTNLSRSDVTDAKGAYTLASLPVGNYNVAFTLQGFQTANVPITLQVNKVARVDMKMQLGAVTESVTVTAAAPVIEKSTSEISTVIDQKQIQALPLNGRNFTQLATLAPGVNRGIPQSDAAGGSGNAETFRYGEFGGGALSVNGLREQFNNFMIEGLDNNETLVNSIAYLPSPETIREFTLITTTAPAEFGRAGGAVQNLVIKSGTNQFHGSAFYFDRPASLAATPKFSPTKPEFNNHDFGLTFGGPVLKDRTFFFGSYHGLRNSIPVEAGNYVTVPTAKMRNGDFSELLNPAFTGQSAPIIIYDPATGVAFPNNVIPPNMINPVGKAYLNAFPMPSRTDRSTQNYLTHRQRKSTYDDFDLKVDQSFTTNNQGFISASHWNDGFADPGRIPGYQAGFGSGQSDNIGNSVRANDTHIFTSNLVNDFRAGWTNFHYDFLPVGFGTNQNAAIGIPGINGVTQGNGISLIGGGNGNFIEYLGDFGQYVITQKTMQASDSVTWLMGDHSFKFGGTLMRRDLAQQRTQYGKGFYFYRDAFGWQQGYTGYEVADMLIGVTSFTTSANPGYVPRDTLSWENSLFAQDDWHLNPKLTLNLGLRWDVLTPYYEKNNKQANYDPTTGALILPDQNGATRSTLKTNWDNFGPRLGFAYLLDEKTSLRGGYGIFYSLDRGGIDRELTENPPAVISEFRFSGPGSQVHLWDPIPLPEPVDPNHPVLPQGSAVVYIPYNSKTTRVQQWSLGAEREIFRNTGLMLAYVGNKGDHEAAMITAAGFSGDIGSRLNTTMYIGSSSYNSLQASLRRTESFGLSYLASYTYGHATNNTVGFYGAPYIGQTLATDTSCVSKGTQNCNLNLDRGPADYDVRNRFTLAATYLLPWAKSNPIVGGWAINGVFTFQSGTPFTVYANGKRADLVPGQNPNGPETVDEWFNTKGFVAAKGAQGTESRNMLRGPSSNSVDLSLFKTFSLGRPGAIELRVEAFNIFNTAQYNNPDVYIGDGTYGQITGTRLNSERQIQLAARYLF